MGGGFIPPFPRLIRIIYHLLLDRGPGIVLLVPGLLAPILPQILEDRKITLQELVDLTVAVAAVGGWKLHIEIPEDLGNTTLNAMVE